MTALGFRVLLAVFLLSCPIPICGPCLPVPHPTASLLYRYSPGSALYRDPLRPPPWVFPSPFVSPPSLLLEALRLFHTYQPLSSESCHPGCPCQLLPWPCSFHPSGMLAQPPLSLQYLLMGPCFPGRAGTQASRLLVRACGPQVCAVAPPGHSS